jgi:hypothetical protein
MLQELACPHGVSEGARRVCAHLLEKEDLQYVARFAGSGLDYDLLCQECAAAPEGAAVPMRNICTACFSDVERWQEYWSAVIGQPHIPEKASALRFVHETVTLPGLENENLADLRPVGTASARRWIAVTSAGRVVSIDLSTGSTAILAQLPAELLSGASRPTLHLSFDGSLAAVFNAYGERGAVLDLANGIVTMRLQRDDYLSAITYFPVAFAVLNGRTIPHPCHGMEPPGNLRSAHGSATHRARDDRLTPRREVSPATLQRDFLGSPFHLTGSGTDPEQCLGLASVRLCRNLEPTALAGGERLGVG